MNTKRIIILPLVLLNLILPLSFVYGNVPSVLRWRSVLEVGVTAEGEGAILNLEISHSSPSSSHYVDSVEVRVDNGDEVAYAQDPQSSSRFSVEIVLEDTSRRARMCCARIEVRSHCTSHGWSAWKVLELGDEEPEEKGGGIPGFPVEALSLGLVIGLFLLLMFKKN